MNENRNMDREIDIVQLLKKVWEKKIHIFVVGLISFFLVGAIIGYRELQVYNDSEEMDKLRTKYQEEVRNYEFIKQTTEVELKNIDTSIVKQSEYNNNSLLMQINPFNVNVAYGQIYVDTNYQIMPDKLYQNQDYTDVILDSYIALYNNGGVINHIKKNLNEQINSTYLQEVIKFSANYNSNIINIRVIGKDSGICEEIFDLIIGYLKSYHSVYSQSIAEHTLSIMNQEAYTSVDMELYNIQQNNMNKISELMLGLSNKQAELKKIMEPEDQTPSIVNLLIKGVKYGLIASILIVMIYVMVIVFIFLFDLNIKDEDDIEHYLELYVIGTISAVKNSDKKVKKDKKIIRKLLQS